MKIKKLRAFSLIELLIVIMIIGILATVSIVSYNGTQKVTRDNQRKADLQAIGTAYKMHYQDTKKWSFNHEELYKIDNSIDPSVNCEGHNVTTSNIDCGVGWFNLEDGNIHKYYVSMAHALLGLGYLSNRPLDPQVATPSDGISGSGSLQYKKLYCYKSGSILGIVLFARLEKSSSAYSDSTSASLADLDNCSLNKSATTPLGTYERSEMNYAIIIK